MPDNTTCPTCKGGGKIDSRDGKPWAELTARRNPEVLSGTLTPKPCPDCRGTGQAGSVVTDAQRATGAVAAVDMRQITPTQPPAAPTPAPAPSEPAGGAANAATGQAKKGGK